MLITGLNEKEKIEFPHRFSDFRNRKLKKKYFSFCCYLPIKHIDLLSNYLKIFHDEQFKKKVKYDFGYFVFGF